MIVVGTRVIKIHALHYLQNMYFHILASARVQCHPLAKPSTFSWSLDQLQKFGIRICFECWVSGGMLIVLSAPNLSNLCHMAENATRSTQAHGFILDQRICTKVQLFKMHTTKLLQKYRRVWKQLKVVIHFEIFLNSNNSNSIVQMLAPNYNTNKLV